MAGFSVPGLQIHRVLKGASDRYRELQDEDWKIEKDRRDQYVEQLSALIPIARTGADIEAINNEIAAVIGAPREKPYKPKLIKTPSVQAPQATQAAQAGQGQQAGRTGARASTSATPPPFDFGQLSRALMGAPQQSGMPDVPESAGGPPDSVGAVPPELAALFGQGGPQTPPAASGQPMVPPVGAGSLGATGAIVPTTQAPASGLTPPSPLPAQVATPPGRSVPEPSPLVGTLPGTPSPVPAAAGPQMGAATPTPTSTPAPISATPPSPFMGYVDKARLPYELNAEFGMSKTGRSLNANAKPLITVKDLVAAAKDGLDIVPSEDSPTGYAVIPRAVDDLTYKQRADLQRIGSDIDLKIARARSLDVRDRLATERPTLMLKLAEMRNTATERNATRRSGMQDLRATMLVKGAYDKGVKVFRDMERGLSQLEALITQRTGPGDYGAVIKFVHDLDDTAAREGEVAMARSAASLANRLEQTLEKWKSGQLFADEVREEFLSAARASNAAFQEHRAEIDQQYGYIADQNGLDRRMVGIPGAGTGTGTGAPTPPPVVGATPSSAAPSTAAPTPAATTSGKRMSKEQINKTTGARRTVYSDDGGRTWHP